MNGCRSSSALLAVRPVSMHDNQMFCARNDSWHCRLTLSPLLPAAQFSKLDCGWSADFYDMHYKINIRLLFGRCSIAAMHAKRSHSVQFDSFFRFSVLPPANVLEIIYACSHKHLSTANLIHLQCAALCSIQPLLISNFSSFLFPNSNFGTAANPLLSW